MRDQKLENLKAAFEQFLLDGNASTFVDVLRFNRCRPPKEASYPQLHRICDFLHGSDGYRVTRLVTDDSELIFVQPSDFADPTETGVPYHLKGANLRRWMDDAEEKSAPEVSPGVIDWDYYLEDTTRNQRAEQDAAPKP